MAQSLAKLRGGGACGYSATEAAIYSRDMLLSLKGIAERQGQKRLAELLVAAADEAAKLASRGE